MNKQELLNRTHLFAVDVFKAIKLMPQHPLNLSIYSQLIRCSASVGANYRAACQAKSDKDFLYKISIVLEEIDETKYWIDFIHDTEISINVDISNIRNESKELTAIFYSIVKTLRRKLAAKT